MGRRLLEERTRTVPIGIGNTELCLRFFEHSPDSYRERRLKGFAQIKKRPISFGWLGDSFIYKILIYTYF